MDSCLNDPRLSEKINYLVRFKAYNETFYLGNKNLLVLEGRKKMKKHTGKKSGIENE